MVHFYWSIIKIMIIKNKNEYFDIFSVEIINIGKLYFHKY